MPGEIGEARRTFLPTSSLLISPSVGGSNPPRYQVKRPRKGSCTAPFSVGSDLPALISETPHPALIIATLRRPKLSSSPRIQLCGTGPWSLAGGSIRSSP